MVLQLQGPFIFYVCEMQHWLFRWKQVLKVSFCSRKKKEKQNLPRWGWVGGGKLRIYLVIQNTSQRLELLSSLYLLFVNWTSHCISSLRPGLWNEAFRRSSPVLALCPVSGSQIMFEWEILCEQKLCWNIPRTTTLWLVNAGIVIAFAVCSGHGTEFSPASRCSIKKCKEELWEHKGKERVAPNFWFYCARILLSDC